MKRILLATAALSALVLGACATSVTDTGTGPIKVGFIGPLTGDVAGLGTDTLNGMKMAVEEINAAGGVNGRMIEIVAEDGRCSGSDAASAAQKLVNVDKVVAIIGGNCSGETIAAAPIVEAGNVVLLSPVSSSPDVTKAGDFVFRDYPSDALKTTAMVAYFKEKGLKKVAMITENTDFSQGFRTSLKSKLDKNAAVFDEVVEPGTKDFRTLMTRLKAMEFDVFFPNGNSDSVIAPMLQQLRDAGMKQPAVSHDAADSVSMATNFKEATKGLFVINVPSELKDGSFEGTFVAKYGKPQYGISFAGYAYDGMELLAKLMGEGKLTGPALRDGLYAVQSYEGVVGTFHFDKNGDVVGIPYVLKEFRNGEIVKVQDISVE